MRTRAVACLLAVLLGLSACEDRGNQKLLDAQNLIELGKFPEAEKLLLEVTTEFPDHAKAYNNLGFLYVTSKQFEKARPAYEKSIELYKQNEPDNIEELANVYDNLGFLDDLQGNQEPALANYRKANETDPAALRPLHNQATLLRKMRQYDKAVELFDKALQIDPYSFQTRIFKALTLLDLQRYEDAIKAYSELLAEDPFKIYLQTQLAYSYMKAGKLEQATQVLANCQAMNPNSAETQSYIILLLARQGKNGDAAKLLTELEALLVAPEGAKAQLRMTAPLARNIGLAHAQLGNEAKSREWLESAKKLDPTDHEAERILSGAQPAAVPVPAAPAVDPNAPAPAPADPNAPAAPTAPAAPVEAPAPAPPAGTGAPAPVATP